MDILNWPWTGASFLRPSLNPQRSRSSLIFAITNSVYCFGA